MASLITRLGLGRTLGTLRGSVTSRFTPRMFPSEETILSQSLILTGFQGVPIRFKGHSKWQNIKHTKAANDARIARMCQRYGYLIGVAIRENGMEKNPEFNIALRKVINSARSEDVPKATIDNAIKRTTNTADHQEFLLELMGPGRCYILVEILAKNKPEAEKVVRPLVRKIGGALERGVISSFTRKGILIVKSPEASWSIDQAENDAIEFGAEEVELLEGVDDESDSRPTFQFLCSPFDFPNVRDKMSAQKYEVVSAGIYYMPNFYTQVDNEREYETAVKLIESLENGLGVTAVHHNLA